MRISIQGVGFDNVTMDEAVIKAFDIMKTGGYIVTPNPEIVMLCRKDKQFNKLVNSADMVVPDGIGIIIGAKILGTPLKERVPGYDLALAVIKKLAERGGSVYLFGSKPGVAEIAAEKLVEANHGLVIAGTFDGFTKDRTPIIDKINETKPDLIIVCLGAPRQEQWMHDHKDKLPSCLMMGIGGALDGYAGLTKRAPEGWQKLGLEWLYRLIKQPSRTGRMLKLPIFILHILVERIKGTNKAAKESI